MMLAGLLAWLMAAGPEFALEVRVPPQLNAAPVEAAAATPVEIRLTRGDGPAAVTLAIEAPVELGGPWTREVDLADGAAVVPLTIVQPPGAPRLWEFPVRALDGTRELARFDVRLQKAGPWWLCGPFPGDRAAAHERVYGPEERVDLATTYRAGDGEVGWRPVPAEATDSRGYCDLNVALGGAENVATYLFAVCDSPAAGPAQLQIGSDDSIKAWHNGKLVLSVNEHRGAEPNQDSVGVDLVAGRNEFLLKVVNDDGGYGFYFTLADPPGEVTWHSGVGLVPPSDPVLRLAGRTRESATFTWRADRAAPTTLHLLPATDGRRLVTNPTPKEAMIAPVDGAVERVVDVSTRSTSQRFTVEGLQPGTRYLAWVDPAIGGAPTERIAFYTAPPAGRAQYVHLKVVCAIFASTIRAKDRDRECPIAVCPPEEIERIKREIDEAVRWYWVNTGARLFIEMDYVVDEQRFEVPDDNVYGVGYSPGDEERLVALLRENGRDIGDYDGRIFISYEPVFDEQNNRWYQPATGGGTIGPEWGPGNCKCAWRCGYNHAWLFAHEFGHGLDALWANSSGPEWLFNHFQPWDQTAHKHGEHWDGNAWLLWWWAGLVTREQQDWPFRPADGEHRFFTCRFGVTRETADSDGDGLPDADPRVPVDEARFGSSRNSADTDGDGLVDLLEMMAGQWLVNGLDSIWAGPHARLGADPRNPDTDGDGQLDGADLYPLYPIDTEIRRGTMRPLIGIADEVGQATCDLGWDVDALTIRLRAPVAPDRAEIMIDADDNGWYLGGDNYRVELRPTDGERLCRVTFQECGVPGRWPYWDDTALTADDWSYEQTVDPRGWMGTVTLKRKPEKGLACGVGERIGLRWTVRPPDAPRWEGQAGLRGPFEPHTFVSLSLMP